MHLIHFACKKRNYLQYWRFSASTVVVNLQISEEKKLLILFIRSRSLECRSIYCIINSLKMKLSFLVFIFISFKSLHIDRAPSTDLKRNNQVV